MSMPANELLRLIDHERRSIVCPLPLFDGHYAIRLSLSAGNWSLVDDNHLIIPPQVARKVTMSNRLAVVTEKLIDPFGGGTSRAADWPQAPFSKRTRYEACLLQNHRQSDDLFTDRMLAFSELREQFLSLLVPSNLSMPQMLPRHQHTASWRTDRCSAVMLCEPNSLRGESINIRRADLLLPVAAEFPVPEIVSENEDDIGRSLLSVCVTPCYCHTEHTDQIKC